MFRAVCHAKAACQRISNYSAHVITDPSTAYEGYRDEFSGRYVGIPFDPAHVTRGVRVAYVVDGTAVECQVIQVKGGERVDARRVAKMMRRLNMMIILLNKMAGSAPRVEITLVLNPHKKRAPGARHEHFCARHVNNGLTYFIDGVPQYIYIYRSEDMYKVMLHELIHFYKLDFGEALDAHEMFRGYCIKDLSGKIDLNEAYTETLACYLWIAMHTYIRHAPRNLRAFKALVSRQVKKSRAFFCKTVAGILEHAGLDGVRRRATCKRHLTQDTHVFSYFVCKAALFFRLSDFLWLVRVGPDPKAFVLLVDSSLEGGEFARAIRLAEASRAMRMIDI